MNLTGVNRNDTYINSTSNKSNKQVFEYFLQPLQTYDENFCGNTPQLDPENFVTPCLIGSLDDYATCHEAGYFPPIDNTSFSFLGEGLND
jgi:hypothetical protein